MNMQDNEAVTGDAEPKSEIKEKASKMEQRDQTNDDIEAQQQKRNCIQERCGNYRSCSLKTFFLLLVLAALGTLVAVTFKTSRNAQLTNGDVTVEKLNLENEAGFDFQEVIDLDEEDYFPISETMFQEPDTDLFVDGKVQVEREEAGSLPDQPSSALEGDALWKEALNKTSKRRRTVLSRFDSFMKRLPHLVDEIRQLQEGHEKGDLKHESLRKVLQDIDEAETEFLKLKRERRVLLDDVGQFAKKFISNLRNDIRGYNRQRLQEYQYQLLNEE